MAEGSYGTIFMIAAIAVLFFFASPGIIWNYSLDQDTDLVESSNRGLHTDKKANRKANKVQLATHAVAFAVVMTFAFPILKSTLGK